MWLKLDFSHVRLCVTLWTVACQAPLSMGFSRQKYWSGLPMASSRRSSWPRDWTHVSYISCIGRHRVHGIAKSWTRLSNWTELNWTDWQAGSLLLAPPGKPPVNMCILLYKRFTYLSLNFLLGILILRVRMSNRIIVSL